MRAWLQATEAPCRIPAHRDSVTPRRVCSNRASRNIESATLVLVVPTPARLLVIYTCIYCIYIYTCKNSISISEPLAQVPQLSSGLMRSESDTEPTSAHMAADSVRMLGRSIYYIYIYATTPPWTYFLAEVADVYHSCSKFYTNSNQIQSYVTL